MNKKAVIHIISSLVVVIGLMILSSGIVGWIMNDAMPIVIQMFISAGISIVFGSILFIFTKSKNKQYKLGVREGFGIVTLGWVVASAFGAIPYIMISDMFWYDAFFETISGFTTTGASVLDNNLVLMSGEKLVYGIADLPKGLLFWRSLTHWLGGMGIVVLSLAILPFLGVGGQQLYNAEVPGPTSDQLTPRIANSAKILWGVYVLLTLVEVLLLWIGNMPMFDAWCHAFGTLATGGFSTQQASIGGYNSAYYDIVICVFMFLAGCNFVLHFKALQGKPLTYWKDEEFRFYFLLVCSSALLIAGILIYNGAAIKNTGGVIVQPTIFNSLVYSFFQVLSIITTTGFATADFDIWPAFTGILLVSLMFVGGCGGSTGGGMKNSRIVLLLKYGKVQLERCLFPHLISNIRLNKERTPSATTHKVVGFFFFFIAFFITIAIGLCLLDKNMDIITALTASIAALGNIGPGLGKVGPTCTYSWVNPSAKMLLSFAMLLGRLELYTVLVLFLPSFWKK